MLITTQSDGATPIASTRRYQRERGFTRGAFVVVPDWPNLDAYCEHDDCIGSRMLEEYALSLAEPRRATLSAR